jgi:hypothetical protein
MSKSAVEFEGSIDHAFENTTGSINLDDNSARSI